MKYLAKILAAALLLPLLAMAPAGHALAAETPPEGGTPKPFTLPSSETISLGNGLEATFIDYGLVPKVTISVVVRTGNLNEAGKVWLADLAGEMMKEGAGTRSAADIALAAADMGGSVGIGVGPDQTSVNISVLSEFGTDAMALLGDIVTRPTLPESELERIRQDFARNLSVSRSQPGALAQEAFLALLYGDHAYGNVYPTEAQLAGYGIEDVRQYYQENFGARRTHIYVAGQFNRNQMVAAIADAFSEWKSGADMLIDPPSPRAGLRVRLIDRPEAPQSTIRLGLPVVNITDPDYIPLQVTNLVLGGYFSSRVTANIREDKGYTYSPRSSISSRYHDAYWVQSADVTTEVTGPALKEIFHEIDRLQAEAPGAAELKSVQNYWAGIFVLRSATPGGLIGSLAGLDLQGVDRAYLAEYVANLFAVTPAQVREMAARHLRDEDMALVVVGDLAKITAQLKALPQLQGVEFQR